MSLCLVLGASGRVGRLLRGLWREDVLYHSVRPGCALSGPVSDIALTDVRCVVQLAGVWQGRDAQALSRNTALAHQAYQLAQRLGAQRLVLCSSAAVYALSQPALPFQETEAGWPERPYGRAKRAMEHAAQGWAQSGPVAITCLRLANVVGADAFADGARHASTESPLVLDRFEGKSSAVRSYLGADRLAWVLQDLAKAAPTQTFDVFNLAEPGGGLPMEDVVAALIAAGVSLPWAWRAAPPTAQPVFELATARYEQRFPDHSGARPVKALVGQWLASTGGVL